ncbi:hypothetical protein MBT42_18545 [Streptomyces sp. MBT42]|uniref:hypothetical protein n=1 Tax=Streptomyces sp. MBT42 TaxID=1488373 RepID=UPI001E475CE5|nr:hypothetical protein [Streptomyces sp. MBT42]MCD2461994.1 hypothetical protein [Streptomyces sp. MBT42]MCD2465557.1 hypothetical protein [Streptomyces sp. MBT42]
MATRNRRPRHCNFCPRPDADTCVRVQTAAQGGAHIYAHQGCAASRGVITLYRFTDAPAPRGV